NCPPHPAGAPNQTSRSLWCLGVATRGQMSRYLYEHCREATRLADRRDRPTWRRRTMSLNPPRRRVALASALGGLLIAVALYGLSWGGSASAASTTTIVFAESGLGTEGQQTQTAITAFEKANPSIKVTIDVLSPNSTTYLQQLQQHFIAGSSTPDVFESDVTYPAKFALAGWIK